jgi:putative toxin-antitoxin system antitoxin component (TIGR02293 family)
MQFKLMLENFRDVVRLLGGRKALGAKIGNRDQLADLILTGLPVKAAKRVQADLDLSQHQLGMLLGMSPATLQRRRERFNPVESDRLYRLAAAEAMANAVFANGGKARHWLSNPNGALGGKTPIAALSTQIGAENVRAILGRIAFGTYS